MRRCPLIALIVVMLLGSAVWPGVCARSKDCCRGGVCHMAAGNCHQPDDASKDVVVFHRATMTVPLAMFIPRADRVRIASSAFALLDGIDRAPERPPRLVSLSC